MTRRSGTVLAATLIVMGMAAMVSVGLMYRIRAEAMASFGTSRGEQAHAAAMSGIETAVAMLRENGDDDVAVGTTTLFNPSNRDTSATVDSFQGPARFLANTPRRALRGVLRRRSRYPIALIEYNSQA